MSGKRCYFIEDAINNVSRRLNLGFKDAYEMDEEELKQAETEIRKYVEFVEHPDYVQFVPKVIETGELILD